MKLNIELYLKVDFIGKRTGRVITGTGKETHMDSRLLVVLQIYYLEQPRK